jgi:nucleoside-diphosphate-sugar epimerase
MSDQIIPPRRVLVTGVAGAIGRKLAPCLAARGHHVRGFDRRPGEWDDDMVVGDLADARAVQRAVEGIDTVVHLAACPDEADFIDVLLEPNVIGLYHVCEQSRQAGVERLILASSMQATTGHHRRRAFPVRVSDGPAPTNFYGLTKVWAEEMGRLYATISPMAVLAVRIGWYVRNRREAARVDACGESRDHVLTHDDANRFFACCVECPAPERRFAIVYAASRSRGVPHVDLEPARAVIGYEPRDRYPDGCDFDH